MVSEERDVVGSNLDFQANRLGVTPDGEWTWYAVSQGIGPKCIIIGMIAESPDLTYFGTQDTYRRYCTIWHEPSKYGEGSIPMSTFRSLDEAVEFMVEQWDQLNQIAAARKGRGRTEGEGLGTESRR